MIAPELRNSISQIISCVTGILSFVCNTSLVIPNYAISKVSTWILCQTWMTLQGRGFVLPEGKMGGKVVALCLAKTGLSTAIDSRQFPSKRNLHLPTRYRHQTVSSLTGFQRPISWLLFSQVFAPKRLRSWASPLIDKCCRGIPTTNH